MRTSAAATQTRTGNSPATRTIELGPERSLHAAIAGAGADIVLLHGAMTTHLDWLDGPFEALAGRGRAIAVDRPGHGLSRRPRFAGDPQVQAAQLREGLRALDVRRPVLVGHSFGCLCALTYAERYPDEVAGLVLIAPLAFAEFRPFEHLFLAPRAAPVIGPLLARATPRIVDREALEAAQRIMFAPGQPDAAWRRNYPWAQILDPGAVVANAEESAVIHPLSPEGAIDLAAIRTPARIISGTADQVVRESLQAAPLAAALPNAMHERVQGAGHMLHWTHGEVLVAAVREALG